MTKKSSIHNYISSKLKAHSQKLLFPLYFLAFLAIITLIILVIIFNYDVRGVESNVVYTIQLILKDNKNLYSDPNNLPFSITQYSPLYYVICDSIISVIGLNDIDYKSTRVLSKIISNVFLFTTSIILFYFFKKKCLLKVSESFLLSSLFIIVTFPWFSISRPDILVAFFLVISLYYMDVYLKKKENHIAFLIGVFLSLGFAAKLNASIFVIIFGLFFLLKKDWKAIFLSAAGFISCTIIFLFILLELGYDLQYLKENIIDGVNNGYSFTATVQKTYQTFLIYYSIFVLGITLLIINKWKHIKNNNTYLSFLILASIITFIYSLITSLKIGAAINYFNELLVILLILTGYLTSLLYLEKRKYITTLLLLFGLYITLFHIRRYYQDLTTMREVTQEKVIIDFLSKNINEGYFFTNNRNINLTFPEKSILFATDIHESAYKLQIYDYSSLQKMIKNGTLKFIITNQAIDSLYGNEVKKHFTLTGKTVGHSIYTNNSYYKPDLLKQKTE